MGQKSPDRRLVRAVQRATGCDHAVAKLTVTTILAEEDKEPWTGYADQRQRIVDLAELKLAALGLAPKMATSVVISAPGRGTCWLCKGWGFIHPIALPDGQTWSDGQPQVVWAPSCAVHMKGERVCPACGDGTPYPTTDTLHEHTFKSLVDYGL